MLEPEGLSTRKLYGMKPGPKGLERTCCRSSLAACLNHKVRLMPMVQLLASYESFLTISLNAFQAWAWEGLDSALVAITKNDVNVRY